VPDRTSIASFPPAAHATRQQASSKGGGSHSSFRPRLQPLRPSGNPIRTLLERFEAGNDTPEFIYRLAFVAPRPPTGIQKPHWRRAWRLIRREPQWWQVRDHLHGRYWIGTVGLYFPYFAVVDIDRADDDVERVIERVMAHLGIRYGENALAFTSRRYEETRAMHIYIPVVGRGGRHCTIGFIHRVLEPRVRLLGMELYPRENKIFRLPLGYGQRPIRDGVPDFRAEWTEALHELLNLEPLDLTRLPHQPELPVAPPDGERPRFLTTRGWCRLEEALNYLRYGLQHPGERDHAQFVLTCYFYRKNLPPDETVRQIQAWIRLKHNGYSKTVNRGQWRRVDDHIRRQVYRLYVTYPPHCVYPDTIHNLEGFITRGDMELIARVYRGDIVNQRRLFKLLLYARPRMVRHDWIFIPRWRWAEVASWANYVAFRRDLERRGLIECDHEYRHVPGIPHLSYPKRFRLRVPRVSVAGALLEDGRAVHDFVRAAVLAFGSPRAAAEALGLPARTAYAVFDLGFSLDRICPGCGAVIENAHALRKYCSDACKMRYHRRKNP